MGDRNSIILDYGEDYPDIIIYTHWHGSMLHNIAAEALHFSRPRWGDEAYCARAIIQRVLPEIPKDAVDITGWGIAPYEQDHDASNHKIRIRLDTLRVEHAGHEMSFDDFIEQVAGMKGLA